RLAFAGGYVVAPELVALAGATAVANLRADERSKELGERVAAQQQHSEPERRVAKDARPPDFEHNEQDCGDDQADEAQAVDPTRFGIALALVHPEHRLG